MIHKNPFVPFVFSLLLMGNIALQAQNKDSITFTQKQWNKTEIKKGIIWHQAHFQDLFESEQEINIIEVDLTKYIKKLKLAGISSGKKLTSTFAQESKALIAINGGFFNVQNGGAVDFIKIDNKVINTTVKPSARANSYFAFDRKKSYILDATQHPSAEKNYPNILLSGPLLLLEGTRVELNANPFNDNRHPRTAIAKKGNKLIIFTVDGRNSQSHGLNLNELAYLFQWYGCDHAMNLDGGGSTTMYIKGQPDHGVVNYPSDNKIFDHQGERAVANIIYIQE
ncbi:hypothetical protein C4F40_03785 [Sphingobacterium sp. Ka21]|uniref:Phosphodiester glycosidase domain-containing protein n=2 Tax=Sphingobacterium pedocola TaxID=2082722 RepID=A0ABR9T3B1_9SPHI|nr:hypothetical protein [Sphingobacterium pedocola]